MWALYDFPSRALLRHHRRYVVVIAMVNRPSSNSVPFQVLAFIGSYSYSIYLWHAALLSSIFAGLNPTLFLFSAYVVVSIGFGIFMSKLIEKPSLAVRDHYFPSNNPLDNVSVTEPTG